MNFVVRAVWDINRMNHLFGHESFSITRMKGDLVQEENVSGGTRVVQALWGAQKLKGSLQLKHGRRHEGQHKHGYS